MFPTRTTEFLTKLVHFLSLLLYKANISEENLHGDGFMVKLQTILSFLLVSHPVGSSGYSSVVVNILCFDVPQKSDGR